MAVPLFPAVLLLLIPTTTAVAEGVEANPFDADFSFDDLPIMLATRGAGAQEQKKCDEGSEATFIRMHNAFFNGTPSAVTMVEMVTCADFCRNNIHPVSGERSDCAGFNYFNSQSPSCAYFTDSTERAEADAEQRAYSFEKKCLHVGAACKHSAFAFDLVPSMKLLVPALMELTSVDLDECLNVCLADSRCMSVNFVASDRFCQINSASHHTSGRLEESAGSAYYENNCIHEKDRCGEKRVEFVISKRTEIRGKDISVGVRDIRNCMRECIESPLVFCRSFEFDATTNECFISEEDSRIAVSSDNLNLYEPVCVDRSLELKCSLPYIFEKFHHKSLESPQTISVMKNFSLQQCIENCLYERNCRSFVYGSDRSCRLLPISSDEDTSKLVDEEGSDFFELSCKLATAPQIDDDDAPVSPAVSATFLNGILTTNSSLETCSWEEVDGGRTVHRSYRNDHKVDVKTMEACRELCEAADFHCVTFAYSDSVHECVLSDTVIDAESPDYDAKSQYNRLFVLFGKHCGPSGIADILKAHGGLFEEDTTGAEPTSSSTIEPVEFSDAITFEPADSHSDSASTTVLSSTTADETPTSTTLPESQSESTTQPDSLLTDASWSEPFAFNSELTTSFSSDIATTDGTTKDSSATVSNSSEIAAWKTNFPAFPDVLSSDENRSEPNEVNESFENISENKSTTAVTTDPVIDESPPPLAEQSIGQLPTIGPEAGHIPPESVTVVAVCDATGVNVTISTHGHNYTGSVYAAERFAQCRTFVHEQDQFSLFVPRPTTNNSCNAVQINDTMKVVIVMSNDRVTPLDVTTKDDLFYEVKCNYAELDDDEDQANIHSGLVVGGPDPRSIFAAIDRPVTQKANVVLRITKDGRAVENVFIGEKLTAVVESDIEPDRLQVIDCNASRIGGAEPKPSSIALISQGCALMPQIMGRVEKVSERLEAPLTAFRIDGSDQIEIACSVLVCKDKCPHKNDTCESRRTRRSADTNSDAVTVDRRLRVFVEGDPKAFVSNNNDLCVSIWVYVSTVAFLGLLLSLSVAFVCVCSKRHRHDLHDGPIDAAIYCPGSEYYKAVDTFQSVREPNRQ